MAGQAVPETKPDVAIPKNPDAVIPKKIAKDLVCIVDRMFAVLIHE